MSSPARPRKPPSRWRKVVRFRPWVQAAFLPLWLAPIASLQSLPGCVFHCYACPLSSAACPIGQLASFAAVHVFPFAVLGVLVVVGALVGSLVCGWACPFGFLQDLAAKLPTRKLRIPAWMGYGRYLVLAALVLAVPYFFGKEHPLFICSVCPAGAMEASLPYSFGLMAAGQPVEWMSWYKAAILVGFVALMLFTYRPWCTVLCPLGAIFSLFNRFSVVFLRFDRDRCTECNLCRSRCKVGVEVEEAVNTGRCIRCMECATCGAITPSVGPLWRGGEAEEQPPRPEGQ